MMRTDRNGINGDPNHDNDLIKQINVKHITLSQELYHQKLQRRMTVQKRHQSTTIKQPSTTIKPQNHQMTKQQSVTSPQ